MCSTIPFYVIGNLSLFISDILREPLGWMFLFAHTHRQKLKAFWNHNFSSDRYQYSRFPDRISIPVTYTKCPSIPYWPLTSVSRARWSITWLSNNNNSNSHSCSNIRLPHTSLPACWKVSNWNAGYSIITYFGRVGESWIKLFPCPGYNVWLGVFVDIRIDPWNYQWKMKNQWLPSPQSKHLSTDPLLFRPFQFLHIIQSRSVQSNYFSSVHSDRRTGWLKDKYRAAPLVQWDVRFDAMTCSNFPTNYLETCLLSLLLLAILSI